MKVSKLTTVAAMALALGLAGCRTTALLDIKGAPYGASTSYKALSLGDYERAIIRAGAERGWVFNRIRPGHLEASITVRGKHYALVDVYYDTVEFSLIHKASRNLNYDPVQGVIHPNYNNWIRNLEEDIRAEVQRMRAA